MRLFIKILVLLLVSVSCSGNGEQDTAIKTVSKPLEAAENYAVEVIPNEGGGFGYIIYKDGKALIRQNHIPGLTGNRSFSSKEDAQKVAELVKDKLLRGSFPPSVTPEELDSLQIQY